MLEGKAVTKRRISLHFWLKIVAADVRRRMDRASTFLRLLTSAATGCRVLKSAVRNACSAWKNCWA